MNATAIAHGAALNGVPWPLPFESPRAYILELLREAGAAGITTPEIGLRLKRSADNMAYNLSAMEKQGLAGWWPDPIGRCMTRRRWWLATMRPERQPPPTGKPSVVPPKSAAPTHFGRFHVDIAPSVINAQECRPWAAAAALRIGGG